MNHVGCIFLQYMKVNLFSQTLPCPWNSFYRFWQCCWSPVWCRRWDTVLDQPLVGLWAHDWSLQSSSPQTEAAGWAEKGCYDPEPDTTMSKNNVQRGACMFCFLTPLKWVGNVLCLCKLYLMNTGVRNVVFLCLQGRKQIWVKPTDKSQFGSFQKNKAHKQSDGKATNM